MVIAMMMFCLGVFDMTTNRAIDILAQEKYHLLDKEVLDWEHITALEMGIKALENEPHCNQGNCVLTMFGECSYNETGCSDCKVKQTIRIALEDEPKKGKWITCKDDPGYCLCSVCNKIEMWDKYNFCPNCGADMRG